MTEPTIRPPRGVRRGLRRAAITVLLILVPFASHALWDHLEMRRLVAEVEKIRARGEPLTEREAGYSYGGTTAEHKQASRNYLAAAMLLSDRHPPELAQLREFVYGGVPAKQSREEIAASLRVVVEGARDGLLLADKANGQEFRGFEPGTEYNYRTAGLGSLSQMLSSRTALLSLADQGEQAAGAALEALRFRRVRRYMRWPSFLSAGGAEVPILLSFASPSGPTLERLQAALEVEEAFDDPALETASQRAWAIEYLWRRYYGADPRAPANYSLPMRSVMESAMRPWITHRFVAALREWAELLDAARKPWPEKARAMAEVQQRARARAAELRSSRVDRATGGLLNVLTIVSGDAGQLLANRCARTAVAVERYRRDHAGALPASLAGLVPAYLAAVPEDPLAGQPLRYRQDGRSYSIYSVGADGKDDDGDLASELLAVVKRGWGRHEIKGRDVGVRVLVH